MEIDRHNLTQDQEKVAAEAYDFETKAIRHELTQEQLMDLLGTGTFPAEFMIVPKDFEITSIQTVAGGFTKGKNLMNHQQVITWYTGTGEAVAMTKDAWQQLADLIPTVLKVLSKEPPKAIEQ